MGVLLVGWTMLFTAALPVLTDATQAGSDREVLEVMTVAVTSADAVAAARDGDAQRAIAAFELAYARGRGLEDVSNLAVTATEIALTLDTHGEHKAANIAWMHAVVLYRSIHDRQSALMAEAKLAD